MRVLAPSLVRPIKIAAAFVFAAFLFRTADAGTLLVYNNNDSGVGSLRQAIAENHALGGGNTIVFSNISGTITLTTGVLLIGDNVTIIGPGANVLTVDGNYPNATNRAFHIGPGVTITISGLSIVHGYATGSPPADYGGAVYNDRAILTLSNCAVSDNIADYGGAIYNNGANGGSASLALIGSTLSYNSATTAGGGIFNDASSSGSATLTVNASTLYANSALDGGGIASAGSQAVTATMAISASTLSGNLATLGDSIYNSSSTLTLGNTILNAGSSGMNIWPSSGNYFSYGYNLASDNGGGFLTNLGDQVNTDPKLGTLQDNGGPTSTVMPLAGSPAIDQGRPDTIPTLVRRTDQRGRVRPYDDPAVPNGPGSDGTDIGAVEVSPPHGIVGTTNDNGPSLRYCLSDAQPGDTITFAPGVVGTILLNQGELLVDQNVTVQGPGANALAVSGNSAGRVFNVSNGIVNISGLTIRDGKVTAAAGQIQDMTGGGIYCGSPATLNLLGCVISNCAALGANGVGTIVGNGGKGGNGYGGGVYNLGGLALSNCWVVGNQAAGGQGGAGGHTIPGFGGNGGNGNGGGIYSSSSQNLSLLSSALSANLATYGPAGGGGAGNGTNGTAVGAGSDLNSGMANLVNSTVASNVVNGAGGGLGGGIYASAGVLLLACTLAGNSADGAGGGLAAPGGGSLMNCIAGANTSGASPDVSGSISSGGYNLVGNTSGSAGFGATGDQLNVNPLLDWLQNNGGPTPTMALLPGSPAVDQGRSFGLTTDQRGEPRPFDFVSIPNAIGGDGSDIGAFERGRPRLSIQHLGSSAVLSWPSYFGDFSLQSSTNLASANSWGVANGTPVVVGNQYHQTNSPISGNQFFRLRGN
jgi:hypothetical protein